ncbi:DMT family transporter [Streptomyces sp. NPDC127084]|uniref:DMT family transporter n=1 Tax=Streptomyces sp. NPDC127084 TaxID=3347133 RepID=UPI00364CD509
MTTLSVALALLAALGNAAASVLQRRAAARERDLPDEARWSWLRRLVHRPVWLWGLGALLVSGLCQAAALATGPLAVVQPVMTTELLFTLVIGAAVFRVRPDHRTRWAFLALAAGLAAFLALTGPSGGLATVPGTRWLWTGVSAGAAVALLMAVGKALGPAPRAAVFGTATAIGFSCTAALVKDTTGRLAQGLTTAVTSWQPYAALAVGLGSFLLLQLTLRAGTLVASQPALTLGDAFLSVVLGVLLFDEQVELGTRIIPELTALAVLVAASVYLAGSPLISGRGGKEESSW